MAKISKAMEQVFGEAMDANSRYDVKTQVNGSYPQQVRRGKTAKDSGVTKTRQEAIELGIA